ncbi:MAG: hypothetical protein IT204_02930 [Fimbriimonadaceae bacterium]|nr:hypothetical protein [Fimbriimonadaceae bacterium]
MPARWSRFWLPIGVALTAAVAYLAVGPGIFPMDDAYIHAVYARHLATTGQLTFNLNPPDQGLGTTSILWPLLLAALQPLGGVVVAARLWGLLAWAACAVCLTVIAGWMTGDARRGRTAACVVLLSGNLVWFTLSGMETMLWVACGLGAVVAYQRRRFALAGVLLGLLMLTRIEGFVLLFSLLAVELLAERRLTRGPWLATALAFLLLSPWLVYVHGQTGKWLPTSYQGKKHAQMRGAVQTVRTALGGGAVAARIDEEHLPIWTIAIYPLGALGYGAAFVAGGAYLPGPRLPLGGELGRITDGVAYAVIPLSLLLYWLAWPTLRRAGRTARHVVGAPATQRALLVLALWFLLHNLAYWAKLPTPGTASRYQVVNHLAWWLLLAVGALAQQPRRGRWPLVLVAALALVNCGWWWTVYRADVRHMRDVRLAAAEYIAARTAPTDVVAAHDIGALGWAMQRRCVDLGGLIDPGWLNAAKADRQAAYLQEQRATWLVLPDKHSSEAKGFFDYAEFLGLRGNPQIRYQPVQSFENDYGEWRRGAMSTWNALPAVTIYRLDWTAP